MSILDVDTLGAFCRHTHVARSGAGSGPLAGLTFGLKDLFDVAGQRTGFGSPDWLATHDPATDDAPVLTTLLAAGASMVGKTHTEEMAFSLTGENAHYGTPINPAAPDRVPGGSSSGSASAVAGTLVDFAIGSDTGGSVRAPASFCGIWGIRPTHGRIPLAHACPLAPSFDTVGWFARDATMLRRVGAVLLGAHHRPLRGASGTRLLVVEEARALLAPAAQRAFDAACDRVAGVLGPLAHGAITRPRVERGGVPDDGLRAWFETFRTLQHAEIWDTHGAWVTRVHPTFGPQIATRFDIVSRTDPADVEAARPIRAAIRAHIGALLADGTLLLMPTVPDVAPLRQLPPSETVQFRERCLQLLCIAGLCGTPQLSMPLATIDGLPFGVSLMAAEGDDERLLALGQEVEQALSHG